MSEASVPALKRFILRVTDGTHHSLFEANSSEDSPNNDQLYLVTIGLSFGNWLKANPNYHLDSINKVT